MPSQSVLNFMKQQGFKEEAASTCGMHFEGLNFQPQVLGTLVIVGIILRSPIIFLALSALLWCSALVPSLNPFEAFYNRVIAAPRRRPRLVESAPGPRRFAQGMAATMTLIIAVALFEGRTNTALVFEALFVMAISALLFGKFCAGAYIYHLLRGKLSFANATLPWTRSR